MRKGSAAHIYKKGTQKRRARRLSTPEGMGKVSLDAAEGVDKQIRSEEQREGKQ
jgi:hypothetical protein